jgi:hypothetical protein
MSETDVSIQVASTRDIPEVVRLYNAYRVFYGAAPDEARASTFIRDRVALSAAQPWGQFSVAQYFLAWTTSAAGRKTAGFMHLMPSTNTLAMRPIWFARKTGAERLTLATAHDNLAAQGAYRKLGYVREEHFWFFHRLLP